MADPPASRSQKNSPPAWIDSREENLAQPSTTSAGRVQRPSRSVPGKQAAVQTAARRGSRLQCLDAQLQPCAPAPRLRYTGG
jgi:hypothetical protein